MSFEDKVIKIREKIKSFTHESLVSYFIRYLHYKPDNEHSAERRPWIAFLALEWALELTPRSNPKIASDKQAQQILEDIWNIQSDASDITNNKNFRMVLRKMIIPQLRFQTHPIQHLYFLFRFYSMLMQPSASSLPKEDFNRITGIEFERFLLFSALLQLVFTWNHSPVIKYQELVEYMCPYFSFRELKKLLNLVGGNVYEIESLIKQKRLLNRTIRRDEYFEEPFLIQKPVLIIPDGITTPHSTVLSIGISEFILRILKQADPSRFKDKFTSSFERYLEELLIEFKHRFFTETNIKSIYKENKLEGKVVDFIVIEKDKTLLIDAKGAEPKSRVLITDNPRILRDQIRDIHLKGVEQVSQCIQLLDSVKNDSIKEYENRHALIVTHQNYYIGDCCDLLEYLLPEHSQKLKKTINNMLPPENIHFCAIEDLEGIVHICNEANTSMCDFLSFCAKEQKFPETRKFDMHQHILEFAAMHKLGNTSPIGSTASKDAKDKIFEGLIDMMKGNQTYWNKGWIKNQKVLAGFAFGKMLF
ncbi:hypothetical protein SAMN05216262_12817 [Colwellia chukchiensis]|uniref:Nuclease-related domain-containing protein n=1 Tax=Colwellia chukchiensis TaxID=641665 RepID=A0A1H7TSL0_9GAMM|nr:hypothetical protein [Colwellia chukchiensis]SEL87489.1 hypothetical protein SAMN05216262_12817 [Colwellia chukchiensis]